MGQWVRTMRRIPTRALRATMKRKTKCGLTLRGRPLTRARMGKKGTRKRLPQIKNPTAAFPKRIEPRVALAYRLWRGLRCA